MRIIKKIQYLPVTIEELKSLNINSYEELESYILNVFLKDLRGHVRVNLYSTYITLEKYIRKTLLVYVKYYIDSSTDDEIILFIQQVANDTVDDRDFKEFIRLRAGALVAKFLDYEEVPYWDNNISTDLDESIFRFVNQL